MPEKFGGPYRMRTTVRGILPWFIINLGIADKGENCEKVGEKHEWYNKNNETSACYHCREEKEGKHWA